MLVKKAVTRAKPLGNYVTSFQCKGFTSRKEPKIHVNMTCGIQSIEVLSLSSYPTFGQILQKPKSTNHPCGPARQHGKFQFDTCKIDRDVGSPTDRETWFYNINSGEGSWCVLTVWDGQNYCIYSMFRMCHQGMDDTEHMAQCVTKAWMTQSTWHNMSPRHGWHRAHGTMCHQGMDDTEHMAQCVTKAWMTQSTWHNVSPRHGWHRAHGTTCHQGMDDTEHMAQCVTKSWMTQSTRYNADFC